VLAGVGSLTLIDDRSVTEEALSVNFLIPPDENVYSGKTIAQLCCDSLKDFNPMVRVFVEKGSCLTYPLLICFLLLHCFFLSFFSFSRRVLVYAFLFWLQVICQVLM
jgi:hypothetical protein